MTRLWSLLCADARASDIATCPRGEFVLRLSVTENELISNEVGGDDWASETMSACSLQHPGGMTQSQKQHAPRGHNLGLPISLGRCELQVFRFGTCPSTIQTLYAAMV